MTPKPPNRRFTVTLKVGGDTWADALLELERRVMDLRVDYHPEIGPAGTVNACSGGPSVGSSTVIAVDPEMTHERYFAEVQRYLNSPKETPT